MTDYLREWEEEKRKRKKKREGEVKKKQIKRKKVMEYLSKCDFSLGFFSL